MCNEELSHEKLEAAIEANKRNSKGSSFFSKIGLGGRKSSTQIEELPAPPSRVSLPID
jgi:hypothetical protein